MSYFIPSRKSEKLSDLSNYSINAMSRLQNSLVILELASN